MLIPNYLVQELSLLGIPNLSGSQPCRPTTSFAHCKPKSFHRSWLDNLPYTKKKAFIILDSLFSCTPNVICHYILLVLFLNLRNPFAFWYQVFFSTCFEFILNFLKKLIFEIWLDYVNCLLFSTKIFVFDSLFITIGLWHTCDS